MTTKGKAKKKAIKKKAKKKTVKKVAKKKAVKKVKIEYQTVTSTITPPDKDGKFTWRVSAGEGKAAKFFVGSCDTYEDAVSQVRNMEARAARSVSDISISNNVLRALGENYAPGIIERAKVLAANALADLLNQFPSHGDIEGNCHDFDEVLDCCGIANCFDSTFRSRWDFSPEDFMNCNVDHCASAILWDLLVQSGCIDPDKGSDVYDDDYDY